jgi:hypothetical protein
VGRPVGWDEVFGFADPAPGDPFAVGVVARSWSRLADAAQDAEVAVRGVWGDSALGAWIGEGGDAFREKTGGLPDQLGKCRESYRLAAQALGRWGPRLASHQDVADGALIQGRLAKQDLVAAQALVAAAGGSAELSLANQYDGSPRAGVVLPSPADIAAARSRLAAAESARADAQARLDAARMLAQEAGRLRADDGRAAAAQVREASEAGIAERSRWDRFKDWASEAWEVVVVVARVVVAVLGIVALIIGGPLAWVVLAAAMVVLADTLAKALRDEATWWDVLFAGLACIPATKGLTTLGELTSAYRMGGSVAAGAHVLGAGKTALLDMAAGVRSLTTGTKTAEWSGEGLALVGQNERMTRLFAGDAARFEPGITDRLRTIAEGLPTTYLDGLDHRLKEFDSLARKVATGLDDDPAIAVDRLLGNANDAVRYTFVTPDADFATASQAGLVRLTESFELAGFNNMFDLAHYKGINTSWRDPVSGQVFEVQFHTPESLRIKTLTHAWYEEKRLPNTTLVREADLQKMQIQEYEGFVMPDRAAEVAVPPGIPQADLPPFGHLDGTQLWSKPPLLVGLSPIGDPEPGRGGQS